MRRGVGISTCCEGFGIFVTFGLRTFCVKFPGFFGAKGVFVFVSFEGFDCIIGDLFVEFEFKLTLDVVEGVTLVGGTLIFDNGGLANV